MTSRKSLAVSILKHPWTLVIAAALLAVPTGLAVVWLSGPSSPDAGALSQSDGVSSAREPGPTAQPYIGPPATAARPAAARRRAAVPVRSSSLASSRPGWHVTAPPAPAVVAPSQPQREPQRITKCADSITSNNQSGPGVVGCIQNVF